MRNRVAIHGLLVDTIWLRIYLQLAISGPVSLAWRPAGFEEGPSVHESDLERDLVSKLAIRELSTRLYFAIDSGDFAGAAACFTEDGVMTVGHRGASASGRPELQALFGGARGALHVNSGDALITIDGDRARQVSRALFYLLSADASAQQFYALATNTDDLLRTDEGWRFTRRSVVLDLEPEAAGEVRRSFAAPSR